MTTKYGPRNHLLRFTIIMDKVGKHMFVLVSEASAQMNERYLKASNLVVLSHKISRQLLMKRLMSIVDVHVPD